MACRGLGRHGYPAADAVDRASAWSPSLSDEAVIHQVRKEGSKSAVLAIKSAIASFNYKFSDQLMLAFGLVHTEEQKAAELSEPLPYNSTGAHEQRFCTAAYHCSPLSNAGPPNH